MKLSIERMKEVAKVCRNGKEPLSREMIEDICSATTPFKNTKARWVTGDDGTDELHVLNLDFGPDALPASGARFWPRADHDTDAALELCEKLLPHPFRLDMVRVSSDDPWQATATFTKAMNIGTGRWACSAAVLPLAILGAAMEFLAAHTTLHGQDDTDTLDQLPPDEALPLQGSAPIEPNFEDLPA